METIKRGSIGDAVKTLQEKLNLIPDGIFGELTEEAVKEFQRKYKLTADGICGAKTWLILLQINDSSLKKSRRRINLIVVHCTATKEGQDMSVEQIRKIHKQQGWSYIGYH